jgi:ABC-2 type transport system permease protein
MSGPSIPPAARPLYWSVRRELWENRSLYIAPLGAAVVAMLAFFFSLANLPRSMRAPGGEAEDSHMSIIMPYGHVSILLVVTAFVVGVFYCLDALYGERRDRSILFWKSLPVSDLVTVLAKAAIPLVVLPLIVFAITFIEQLIMLLLSAAVLQFSGLGVAMLWAHVPLFEMALVLLYCLVVTALWHAPIYAWLLLVSVWARRTTFLWAFFPPAAVCVFEKITFNTTHVASFLGYRLLGLYPEAIRSPVDPHFVRLAQLTPGQFLASPGLWSGLLFAALFLAAAARLRRYRGPI